VKPIIVVKRYFLATYPLAAIGISLLINPLYTKNTTHDKVEKIVVSGSLYYENAK
jgi:hypothetical protein